MGETARSGIIRQRARAARDEHQARVMTPARAWRLAVGRAADELFDLGLIASSIEASEAIQYETVALFSDDCLMMLLDGPGGARGAVSLELPILAGLIEKQTMGVVLQRSPDLRPPTPTDAALAAPLIEAILSEFSRNLSLEEGFEWTQGFRFGAMVEESRLLGLTLDSDDYHIFRLHLDMEGGAKQGEMIVALPVPPRPPLPEVCDDPGESDETAADCPRRLGQGALIMAEAPLNAALFRMRMTLNQLGALKPGDILTVPRAALEDTRLETIGGDKVVKCKLGQMGGFRAVRLSGPRRDGPAAEPGDASSMADGVGDGMADALPTPDGLAALGAGAMPLDALGGIGAGAGDLAALDLPETGAGMSGQPDSLPGPSDLPDLADLPPIDGPGGMGALPDLPDLPPLGESGGLGDLDDLDDLGDFGDLGDLPELALDDLPELK